MMKAQFPFFLAVALSFSFSGCYAYRGEMTVVNKTRSTISFRGVPTESCFVDRFLYNYFWGIGLAPCWPEEGDWRIFVLNPSESVTVKDGYSWEMKSPQVLVSAFPKSVFSPHYGIVLEFLEDDEFLWIQAIGADGKTAAFGEHKRITSIRKSDGAVSVSE